MNGHTTTAMLALVLVSCTPIAGPEPGTPSDPTPAGAPVFANPAEAVDLDPAAGVLSVRLVAEEVELEVGGGSVPGFAYNGQVPGPTLRATLGDTLRVELENRLSVGRPSTGTGSMRPTPWMP